MKPIVSKWSGCFLSHPTSRAPRVVALMLALVSLLLALLVACSPAARKAEAEAADVATKSIGPACVVIKAIALDDTIREICATAEELAPLVDALIQARLSEATTAKTTAPLVVAASLPAPKKKFPRRHCAAWVSDESGAAHDAGIGDAGGRNEAGSGGGGAGIAGSAVPSDGSGAKGDGGGGG